MRDLCLSLNTEGTGFCIIPEKDNTMPDVVKAAIVLLFFSKLESMRFMQGEGIYGMIAQATTGSDEFFQSNLAFVSTDLRNLLTREYPDITNVYLDYEIVDSTLNININITKSGEVIKETIYNTQL